MKEAANEAFPAWLEVNGLSVQFQVRGQVVHAVRDVHFTAQKGRVTGLVGESGSGKTTVSRVIVGLQPADSGSVRFDGIELTGLSRQEWVPIRKRIQMVFQDPYRALNPALSIRRLLEEPIDLHFPKIPRKARVEKVEQLLATVGLESVDPARKPATLSGGQRQRVGIARALAVEPELLILDEPVSALDVSVQAQILNLLSDLRQNLGLTCLFIGHDLAVVEHLCDDMVVMEHGQVVETGSAEAVYGNPHHPYTRKLLAAAPRL